MFYSQPGDTIEAWVEGFQVDVLRDDLLIEIQTGNFSAIKRKLITLLPSHPILLVYPVALQRWIVRLEDGASTSRRRSPRKGKLADLFYELVYIADLAQHPNLSIEIALLDVEEIRVNDGKGSWRRNGWTIFDRKMLTVHQLLRLSQPVDYCQFIPDRLSSPFAVKDFANCAGVPYRLAGKMVYCLVRLALLHRVGKSGRVVLYGYGW